MKYGCKSYTELSINGDRCYEERVLCVEADSFEEAVSLAEIKSMEYAKSINGIHVDYIQCYKAKEFDINEPVSEIYSLIRKSKLDHNNYLDFFEDTGNELSRSL